MSKVEATKRLGAEVVLTKGAYDDAYEQALRLQKETGATLIHPFLTMTRSSLDRAPSAWKF